jgi:hypothetical protein
LRRKEEDRASLPVTPFYVSTSPAPAPAPPPAPEVSPTRKNTDWNARESWAGKPPPYEELVGFKPKPKEEVVPTDATKNKNAGDVADVASSSNASNAGGSSFAANLSRRVSTAEKTNSESEKKIESKREDEKTRGLGGVLAKALGFDRRKNMPAVAAEVSEPPRGGKEEARTTTEVEPETRGDDDDAVRVPSPAVPEPRGGGLTASDQMARLAALKDEEEARLARQSAKSGNAPPGDAGAEAPPEETSSSEDGNVSEKEALRREREELMRAQSARAAAKAAAKEKEKEQETENSKSPSSETEQTLTRDAKTPEDEAFEARVRAAKGESIGDKTRASTDATDAPDPRPPVAGWGEKPSAAAPPARPPETESRGVSSAEVEIPKMPAKSFDEISFEERVAMAMAQSKNSGVADRVQKALIREEKEEGR